MSDQPRTDTRSPEEVLAEHFMARSQRNAPAGDARRTRPLRDDRLAAHDALTALRLAGWKVIRA